MKRRNSTSLRATKQSTAIKQIASFLAITLLSTISCNQNTTQEKSVADSVSTKVEEPVPALIDTPKTKQEIAPSKTISQIDTTAQQKVTVEIFSNDTTTDAALHGYGYNILMDGKLYVHQPHIPAVPGNKGFASVADAKKVGVLIKYKVEHHIMPPSVSVEELDSLKISWK